MQLILTKFGYFRIVQGLHRFTRHCGKTRALKTILLSLVPAIPLPLET